MDLESEDGFKIPIEFGSEIQIGRELGLGFGPSATDRTVSRRHLSLRLIDDPVDEYRVGFEVTGRNPVWVCGGSDGGRIIYKNSEKGELRAGDKLSLSLKKPSFWVVKQRGAEDEEKKRVLDAVERRERRTSERRREKQQERAKEIVFEGEDDDEEEFGGLDVSQIDPVKEFGFIVKGHEFDHYPKKRILGPMSWNWFLEEKADSTDDDDNENEASSSRGKKGEARKKKKGGKDEDDDEWTGESEEEEVAVVKGGGTKRPKYSTRSKDMKRPRKNTKVPKDEVEEEDEEDETLGGFIVDEEEEEEEEDEEEFDGVESEEELDDEEEDEED